MIKSVAPALQAASKERPAAPAGQQATPTHGQLTLANAVETAAEPACAVVPQALLRASAKAEEVALAVAAAWAEASALEMHPAAHAEWQHFICKRETGGS